MNNKTPFFYDVTLRDGNQALATPWNTEEKERVFQQLLALGVQGIEVGFAGASEMDFEACRYLASKAPDNVVISSLARAVPGDIERAWEAVKEAPQPRIHTFIATSPFTMENVLRMEPEQVKAKAAEAVAYARKIMGDKGTVQFSAEHFGDCQDNLDFVIEVFQAVVEAGATTINLPNTVERYRPMLFVNMVEKVVNALPEHVTVAVHNHNDLGMATAATVESYFAGAVQLETALNGLGERAGNTNMYEVAMALYNSGAPVDLNLHEVYETALLVSKWADLPIPDKAPLIGPEAVAHRSGIHQDGAAKTKGMKKGAYRPIDFGVIGRNINDMITFTSQSGKTAVYEMLSNSGYRISLEEAAQLQPVLKDISEKEGELSEQRVLEIFRKERVNRHGRLVFSSVNGMRDENAFVFRFKKDGTMKEITVSAEGPIEACILLLREEGFAIQLLKYNQGVVSKSDSMWAGRALSEIELEANGRKVTGRGVHNDTMMANMLAVFSGTNLLFS